MLYPLSGSYLSINKKSDGLLLKFIPANDGIFTMLSLGYFIAFTFIVAVFPDLWTHMYALATAALGTLALLFFVWVNTGRMQQCLVTQHNLSIGQVKYASHYITDIYIQPAKKILSRDWLRKLMGWNHRLAYYLVIEYKGRSRKLPVKLDKVYAEQAALLIKRELMLLPAKPLLKPIEEMVTTLKDKEPAIIELAPARKVAVMQVV